MCHSFGEVLTAWSAAVTQPQQGVPQPFHICSLSSNPSVSRAGREPATAALVAHLHDHNRDGVAHVTDGHLLDDDDAEAGARQALTVRVVVDLREAAVRLLPLFGQGFTADGSC